MGATEKNPLEGKTIGQLLAEGMEELAEALQDDAAQLPKKFTCRRLTFLRPQSYTKSLVKQTRETLNASQTVFAHFIGVSPKTVRSWEQGINTPRDAACRLMDEIRHNPAYWIDRMRSLAVK